MISFRAIKLYAYLLLFFVVLMTFLPCVGNDFVNWDDYLFVTRNSHISSFSWESIQWMLTTFYQGAWHPLTWLSHALDRALWGLNPAAHHLINVIIHAFNALLACVLFIMLQTARVGEGYRPPAASAIAQTRGQKMELTPASGANSVYVGAFAAALLFAVHPLRVESVAWVSERKDVLCAFFFLAALITYLKYARAGNAHEGRQYYLYTLGICFLAILSKPMAVTLPFVFFLFDFFPLCRLTGSSFRGLVREKLPFLLLSLGAVVVNLIAAGRAGVPFSYVPASMRIMNAFYGVIYYLRQTVLPADLLPLYQMDRDLDYFGPKFVLSAALVLLVTGIVIWRALKRDRVWAAVWFYYLITLAPVLGLFMPYRHAVADRYTYLTTLGFWFLAALGISRVWQRAATLKRSPWLKAITVGALAALLVVCVYKTHHQIGIWKDSQTLWSHVIEHADYVPDLAFFGVGRDLEEQGEWEQALAYYNIAFSLNPKNQVFRAQIGNVLLRMGDLEGALKVFTETREAEPNNPVTYVNVGRTLALMKRYDDAAASFEKALEMQPSSTETLLMLTLVSLDREDRTMAETYYRKYLALGGPSAAGIEQRLGIASSKDEK